MSIQRFTPTDELALNVTRDRLITEAERLNRVSPIAHFGLAFDLCGLATQATHFLSTGWADSAEVGMWLSRATALIDEAKAVPDSPVQYTTTVQDMYGYLQYTSGAGDRYSEAIAVSPIRVAHVQVGDRLITLGFESSTQQYMLSVSLADERSAAGWKTLSLDLLDTLDSAFDLLHSYGLILTADSAWAPAPQPKEGAA